MSSQRITINSLSYDLSIRKSWECDVLRSNDQFLEAVGEFDRDVEHPDLGSIPRGARSIETFYFDRWYNHFVFLLPDETVRNHYFNICMPPRIDGKILSYVDLDIDVLVWPDGIVQTLDLVEFEENKVTMGYPPDVSETVLKTLKVLLDDVVKRLSEKH